MSRAASQLALASLKRLAFSAVRFQPVRQRVRQREAMRGKRMVVGECEASHQVAASAVDRINQPAMHRDPFLRRVTCGGHE